ncbi:Transcription initiation factor TFIID subunit 1 [Seminavis robusta]|uniref:Transcription initiation factor TFIID subunit 1 n=1 Tax=Seminavis robusta TaxID=568900 RepID=A0A9N8EKH2_9STRA|nr:Transcription initiation factor TFIID subunit 1 [Seminavis robusta]|eukprot:Sro1358_g265900.1 Transcription initiation factor TFIID subunit 1 (1555) ;mRNA; r:21360-26429
MATSPAPTAASAAMALPPSSAPALDFEQLLSRDLQDTRPARVTRMIPQEKFVKDERTPANTTSSTNKAILAAQDASAEPADGEDSELVQGEEQQQFSALANKLVRTLVATTPAFVSRLEAQHAEADEEDKDINWKTSLANRTQALLEELTGSSPTETPLMFTVQDDSKIDSKLHEVEMGDWEKKIEWQGLADDTTTTSNTNGNNNSSNGNASTQNGGSSLEKTTKSTDPMKLLMQRRNHWLDTLQFDNSTVNWEGVSAARKPDPIPLLLELGVAGQSVARHVFPSQRPPPGVQSKEYQKRMELEWSSGSREEITSTADVNKAGSLHADREKMEALIEARQKKRAQMAMDKTNRVTEAMGTLAMGPGKGRTITSSLMGPGGTERTGRPSRHNVGTTSANLLEFLEQLDMVANHSLVRDLGKVSLREYHRPKLPKSVVRSSLQWQFQIRYLASILGDKPNAPGARGASASYTSMMMGTHPGAMSRAKLRSEADLSTSEGKLVLLEYCEERPPIQLTKGMATKIVNYYRGDKAHCPVSRGGGDRPTRKKKRSENESPSKVKTTTKNLLGDRPPRLEGPDKALKATAADWIGKIPKKSRDGDAANKNAVIDMLPEGVTEMLHPKVHGPFIGEVEEGMTISGLISLLFVAPLFRQEPESTDFLMILGRPSGGGIIRPGVTESLGVMLREFPSSVYTVGQTEPRTRVYAPNTQGWKNFIHPFVSYQIAKLLARTQAREGHGLRFDEIQDRILPSLEQQTNALRQRLKQVAIYDKNTQIWTTKAIGYEEYPGVEALGRSIAPEGVAAYETASASARRLKDLGLCQLFEGNHSVGSVGITMIYLAGQVNAAKELHRKAKKLYELSRTNKALKPSQVVFYEKAAEHLELQWKALRQRHEVCKFIYEELQLTPWHLTGEFIEVHKKGEGSGMMKLTGLGDPSGLGEGFSFLREADSKPSKSVGAGALNAQMKKITGTEDDLRKLTMKQMAALLRKFGMAQKQIDTLKRWDRVHVIRDFSTRSASDGMGEGLEKFARGEKMKLSEQKQVYRKRIQVIWKRQIAALSASSEGGAAAGDAEGGTTAGDTAGAADADTGAAAADATNKASQKKKQDKKEEDSESDSDDDWAADFEEEMMDGSAANQLVAAHTKAGDEERAADHGQLRAAVQDQDLTKDARELAALKRQREEERAAREGMASAAAKGGTNPSTDAGTTPITNRKVVRKKIVKTFPDGRQTTTFKFICRPDEVGSTMAKIAERESKGIVKPHQKLELLKYDRGPGEKPPGHAMFEDEDEFEYATRARFGGVTKKRGRGRGRGSGTPTGAKRGPKPRTLQLGKLKTKVSKEQRMKKRKREEEEADLYTTASKRKGTSNRKERGSIRDRRPHVIFAERLESIRAMAETRPHAGPFLKPVNRRAVPKYYEVISNPIDLSTIRDKIQRYEYRTADAFVKDFELMKNNAIKFNGAGTLIADEAVAMHDAVREQVDASRSELTGMEEAVKEQLSGKPKKKKKKKKAGSKKAAEESEEGTMGLIGGVEVNLGDLGNLGLGELGSDDEASAADLINFD